MVKTKYRTSSYNITIQPIQIDKETASYMWVGGKAYLKVTDQYTYFDTWERAKIYLVQRCEIKIRSLYLDLQDAKEDLRATEGLEDG